MINFLLMMLLSNTQKCAYYAQYCAHDYFNMPQFVYNFIILITSQSSIVRLQINFYLLFQDSVLLVLTYYAQYYAHKITCVHRFVETRMIIIIIIKVFQRLFYI